MAVSRTVAADLHAVARFILSGPGAVVHRSCMKSIRSRVGRGFSRRRLTAWQDARVIFIGDAAFHVSEQGLQHGGNAGSGGAGVLPGELELLAGNKLLIDQIRSRYAVARAIDVRPVRAHLDPSAPAPRAPSRSFWFKVGALSSRGVTCIAVCCTPVTLPC